MGEAARTDPALVRRFLDSDPAWKLACYVFECMEHRRESGRVIVSSEESFGSSSDDDSIMWTEELDFVSVMLLLNPLLVYGTVRYVWRRASD